MMPAIEAHNSSGVVPERLGLPDSLSDCAPAGWVRLTMTPSGIGAKASGGGATCGTTDADAARSVLGGAAARNFVMANPCTLAPCRDVSTGVKPALGLT